LTEPEVVVVGGGAIGLSVAAALARNGRSVVLLERHDALARETTARSSEVIHAGIYYPPDSLKAKLCVSGRIALYERCRRLGIPHRRTGKLIVATSEEEVSTLESIARSAEASGVGSIEWIDAREVTRREPAARAVAALHSPETGIVDAQALCMSFAAEAEAHGADIVLCSEVRSIEHSGGLYRVEATGPAGDTSRVASAAVVNAAGLAGDRLAELAGFDVDALGYRLHFCKGDYFTLQPGSPVRVGSLVYPVPAGAGLGIHATLDLAGRIRFGPDSEYVDRIHYEVDALKVHAFGSAIRRFLPAVEDRHLAPDYAGVRPRLSAPGEAFRDFLVREESSAGLPGFVNALGIESPGLTSAPAIAELVTELLSSL
jgi:L-2-hydroxyglutarate oxidase LhgO